MRLDRLSALRWVAAFDENGVQIGIVFQTATPSDTPRLMTELVTLVQEERAAGRLHPLLDIAAAVAIETATETYLRLVLNTGSLGRAPAK